MRKEKMISFKKKKRKTNGAQEKFERWMKYFSTSWIKKYDRYQTIRKHMFFNGLENCKKLCQKNQSKRKEKKRKLK